jgi:iron complex outermembrane receptor protein
MRRSVCCLAAVLALWPCGEAPAIGSGLSSPEEEFIFSESEIVTSATLSPERASAAPASVTVVTAEEIRRHGYRTLAEILRGLAGFFVVNDRDYEYAGARGLLRPGDYNNRILILLDGHPLNDDWIGASAIGVDLGVNLLRADRIEIVRGPGSALYGSNALVAVVNIVTLQHAARAGKEFEVSETATREGAVHAAVAAGGGVWDSADLHAEVEGRIGDSGRILVTGSVSTTAGEPTILLPATDELPGGFEARDLDSERARDVSLRCTAGPIEIDGMAVYRHKTVPTGSFGTVLGDRRGNTNDRRAFLRGRLRTRAARSDIEVSLSEDYFHYDGAYPYFEEDAPISTDDAVGYWTTAGVIVRPPVFGRQELTLGGEHQWHELESGIRWLSAGGEEMGRFDMPDDRFQVWNFFAQDIVALGRGFEITAGSRFDHYPHFGGEATGRVAVVWSARAGTVLKAVAGTAFRAPSRYELFYTDNGESQVASPDLHPERLRTQELSVEQDLLGAAHLRISAFKMHLDGLVDLIELEDGLLQYQNSGHALSRGLELAGRWNGASGLLAHATLSVLEATHHETGIRLSNTPRLIAGAGVSVPVVRERLFASALVRVVGERPTLTGDQAPAYGVADLALLYRGGSWPIELSLRAQNLFDERYYDPGSPEHPTDMIPQPGRFISMRALYAF